MIGILQRKGLNLGSDGHLGSQGKKFLAILAGKVGYRSHHSFTPEDIIRERGDGAHVDAAADHDAAFGSGSQGGGQEGTDGSKDYGGVQGYRRFGSGIASPDAPRERAKVWVARSPGTVKA